MVPNSAPPTKLPQIQNRLDFLWVFIEFKKNKDLFLPPQHPPPPPLKWDDSNSRGKGEREHKIRAVEGRKQKLLPPYFVNKSDLQDKRSATFQLNSQCMLRVVAQNVAAQRHEPPADSN